MKRGLIVLASLAILVGVLSAPGAHAGQATREPISGNLALLTMDPPDDISSTPSGIEFWRGGISHSEFDGDIEGFVDFLYKRTRTTYDGPYPAHMVSKGPFEGEVTWDGRTGWMSGMFTTNCRPDATDVFMCGGTMIGHGSGELDGVKFHIVWGPNPWFPFTYEGFALDTNR